MYVSFGAVAESKIIRLRLNAEIVWELIYASATAAEYYIVVNVSRMTSTTQKVISFRTNSSTTANNETSTTTQDLGVDATLSLRIYSLTNARTSHRFSMAEYLPAP
jgi:hypothetical protein